MNRISNHSQTAQKRLEAFSQTGDKHAFKLLDGQSFEGWVMDVTATAALVARAPSPFHTQASGTDNMAAPDEWIPIDQIDAMTLSYYDKEKHRWLDFE
jgi:hypothetical protein